MGYGGKIVCQMNVWIDIIHTPQLNFYRPLISKLSERGHMVYVTVLDRGRLAAITKKELHGLTGVEVKVIGKRRMSRLSVILEANIFRVPLLFFWLIGKHIDVSISNGFHNDLLSHVFRFPAYNFGDDPAAAANAPIVKYSTKSYSLLGISSNERFLRPGDNLLPVLKEWAYLSPLYLTPKMDVLNEYGLTPKSYILLREVSVSSMNYSEQKPRAILAIRDLIPGDMKVLLSLEEKKNKKMYPDNWALINEPVSDFQSLIYYSAGLISSGDSMAREAALMGVPSFYLGVRSNMPANIAAAEVAPFYSNESMGVKDWLAMVSNRDSIQRKSQEEIRRDIDERFIDITEFMYNLIDDAVL